MGADGPDGNAIRESLTEIQRKLQHAADEAAGLRRDIVKYYPNDDLMLWVLDCVYQVTRVAEGETSNLLSRFP